MMAEEKIFIKIRSSFFCHDAQQNENKIENIYLQI